MASAATAPAYPLLHGTTPLQLDKGTSERENGGTANSDGNCIEKRGEEHGTNRKKRWGQSKRGNVALALKGEVADVARVASQCLELLASQSVTAVNVILA